MEQKARSFLARWLTKKLESSAESEQSTVDFENAKPLANELPNSILVFTPEQEQKYSEKMKDTYRHYLAQMGRFTIGEVNFIAFEAGHYMGGVYVRCFITFARDLEEEFTLGAVPISLRDATGEVVSQGVFEPKDFGTLRFGETRVWTFAWRPDEVVKKEPDFTMFTIRFE